MDANFVKYFVTTYQSGETPFVAALTPEVSEIVGARLMRALHIGSPTEVRVGVTKDEAIEAVQSGKWICKTHFVDTPQRLQAAYMFGDTNTLIRRIPNTVSLFTLRVKYKLCAETPAMLENVDVPDDFRQWAREWGWIISQGHQNFYLTTDFKLPADTSEIKKVIQWDSEPMLKIHAARLFLGCSTAHAGNVLVDADANLYSIDHESVQRFDGEDLVWTFDNIRPHTRAWFSLGSICSLSEQNIVDCLSGLPDGITWPLGSQTATEDYFLRRLNYWQRRFFEQSTMCNES